MGSGIAEVCARNSVDVVVIDADDVAIKAGQARVEASLAKAVGRGKLSAEEQTAALGRLSFSTELDALADRDLVIEAATENETVKTDIFRRLDEIVESDDAVLASNTSSIPIMRIAAATRRPERVMGMHFFNPVPVMALVELVSSLVTGPSTLETVEEFAAKTLGKHVIHSQDRSGFIVNALLVPYLLSAIRMLESGFATAEDIDAGMVHGCAHPIGPLALSDLIGLDTAMAVADTLYEELKEPLYAPPPLLRRMVEAGLLGRKSGRGFFAYDG